MRARVLNGYRVIYLPEHPAAMKNENWNGFVYEHIVVAEKSLGRRLFSDEVCHHLDGNRGNNCVENILVLSRAQHTKLHEWLKRGATGIERSGEKRVNSGKSKGESNIRFCENPKCGRQLQKRHRRFCSKSCSGQVYSGGHNHPDAAVLASELQTMTFTALGRKYGVSDNAVRKWAQKLDLL